MLKHRNNIPLDYSLCCMTATVYHREGLTRRVISNVHYEFTDALDTRDAIATHGRDLLLVIPGEDPIAPGDKVLLGIGPEIAAWEQLDTVRTPTLAVVTSVKPRFFRGRPCHTEARAAASGR